MKKRVERYSLCGQKFSSGIHQMRHEAGCAQCQTLRAMVRQGKLGTLLEEAKAAGLIAEAPARTEEPKDIPKERQPLQRRDTLKAVGILLFYGLGILLAGSIVVGFFALVVVALLKYVFG